MFLALAAILYFGFDIVSADLKTKDSKIKEGQSSEIKAKSTEADINILNTVQKAELKKLEEELDSIGSTSAGIPVLKKLSSFWYAQNSMELAGDYATKVAELSPSGESWGIAGTSYLSGITEDAEEKVKIACKEKAISALNKAISLEPNNPQHKMNLGLCFVKLPGENPMEGILKLLELDKEFPDYVPVQIVLSQLAINTGQWDKAFNRLTKLLLKHPEQKEANCLIIEVIQRGGMKNNTDTYKKYCTEN